MFLVILPLSVSDSRLVDGWVTVFRALKGAPKCHFVLVPTPDMRTKAKYAGAAMQGYCASVEVRALEVEPRGEFPRASNEHFKAAMFIRNKLAPAKKSLPWIWMELDALPLVENWDGTLHNEYVLEAGNAGWMGVLTPMVKEHKQVPRDTPYKDVPALLARTKGTITVNEQDLYMEGVGVYPHNFDVLTDRQWQFTKGDAFDQKLRAYAKRNWHSTDLIQSRWRTGNYQVDPESGEVSGEDLPSNPHGTVHAGTIHAGVVLFHGCKDTSLQQIMAESRGVEIRSVESMAEQTLPQAIPQRLPTPKAATSTKGAKGFKPAFRIQPKKAPTVTTTEGDAEVTVESILEKLQEKPKNQRVDEWAQELHIPTENLIELVNNSKGRLKLTGVARWLKAA